MGYLYVQYLPAYLFIRCQKNIMCSSIYYIPRFIVAGQQPAHYQSTNYILHLNYLHIFFVCFPLLDYFVCYLI